MGWRVEKEDMMDRVHTYMISNEKGVQRQTNTDIDDVRAEREGQRDPSGLVCG